MRRVEFQKDELQGGEIPEFERRQRRHERRHLRLLEPQTQDEVIAQDQQRSPFFIFFVAVGLFLLLGLIGAAIWWFTQPKPILGVFSAYEMRPGEATPIEPPFLSSGWISYRVRKKDSFTAVANSLGISPEEVSKILEALKPLPPQYDLLKEFRPGQLLKLQFSRRKPGLPIVLNQLLWQPEAHQELSLRRTKDNTSFAAKVQTLQGVLREHVAVGTIRSSFAAAAQEAGVSYDIVDDLVDLFSNRIEFNKDFQPGDRFSVIYRTPVLKDGSPMGDPQILAAALEVKGEHLVAARYVGVDGKARYFDEKGNLLGNSFLRYPLKFSRISSYFSEARFHPVLKFTRPHNGIDFAAPIGTPVRTVADGVVVFAGYKGGNGNMVKIRHNERYSTAYLHLSSISKGIKNGAKVHRGEVIGGVGMTGLATGPHLHFSFFDGEKYVNPLKTLLPMLDALEGGNSIDPDYLKKVLFTIDHYQNVTLSRFYSGEE